MAASRHAAPRRGGLSPGGDVGQPHRADRRPGRLRGWTALLGAAGTGFHLYGLHRRYGGYGGGSFLFNWLNGPPAPAPLQMIGLGLAGLAAERAGSRR